jgi:hypothetical protein
LIFSYIEAKELDTKLDKAIKAGNEDIEEHIADAEEIQREYFTELNKKPVKRVEKGIRLKDIAAGEPTFRIKEAVSIGYHNRCNY